MNDLWLQKKKKKKSFIYAYNMTIAAQHKCWGLFSDPELLNNIIHQMLSKLFYDNRMVFMWNSSKEFKCIK